MNDGSGGSWSTGLPVRPTAPARGPGIAAPAPLQVRHSASGFVARTMRTSRAAST